jgi:hypothetical protein
LLEERVGSRCARIERRAGHRKYLAVLLKRHSPCDQRTGFLRRLDHNDAERQAGNQAVAPREVASAFTI